MTRTTIDLDPIVLRELRARAAREQRTMGDIASEALAVGLAAEATDEPAALRWTARSLGRPLIDLEDKELMSQLQDEPLRKGLAP